MFRSISVGVAALMAMVLFAATALAATSTVVVTSDGEAGWVINGDSRNTTPYEFSADASSIGLGSIHILPIENDEYLPDGNQDKFTAELNFGTPVAELASITYDFLIAGGDTGDAKQFYLNIYTLLPEPRPADAPWYDCRFDYVPTAGSTSGFTRMSVASGDVPSDIFVKGSGCPSNLAEMLAGSTVLKIVLNVGDTSANDTGVGGYYDNVVVTGASGDETVYDFEAPGPTSKDDCKEGGWEAFGFSNQGLCVSSVNLNS